MRLRISSSEPLNHELLHPPRQDHGTHYSAVHPLPRLRAVPFSMLTNRCLRSHEAEGLLTR
jgi:hypothetical protein